MADREPTQQELDDQTYRGICRRCKSLMVTIAEDAAATSRECRNCGNRHTIVRPDYTPRNVPMIGGKR